jgi:hypothetical protein
MTAGNLKQVLERVQDFLILVCRQYGSRFILHRMTIDVPRKI